MSNNINRFRKARNTITRLIEGQFGEGSISSEVVTPEGALVKFELPIGMEVSVTVTTEGLMVNPVHGPGKIFTTVSIRKAFEEALDDYNQMIFNRSVHEIICNCILHSRTTELEFNVDVVKGDMIVSVFNEGLKISLPAHQEEGVVRIDDVVKAYLRVEEEVLDFRYKGISLSETPNLLSGYIQRRKAEGMFIEKGGIE